MQLHRWLAGPGLALLLVITAGCQPPGDDAGSAATAGSDEEEESAPVPVEVGRAIRDDVFAVYTGTAALETDEDAMVVAKVAGEVESIAVEEGDPVKAGQVLARLDGDRLRLEMERARANLAKLEQEYQRNIQLKERGLVSATAFEDIKYEMEALRAAYNLARLEVSYTEIKAPVDGVVATRFIKVGNTLAVNDQVFHITGLDPLIAYLHVPESPHVQDDPPVSLPALPWRAGVDGLRGEAREERPTGRIGRELHRHRVPTAVVQPGVVEQNEVALPHDLSHVEHVSRSMAAATLPRAGDRPAAVVAAPIEVGDGPSVGAAPVLRLIPVDDAGRCQRGRNAQQNRRDVAC